MKILITENKLKSLITKMVGYDLSDRIEMITSWDELCIGGEMVFRRSRETFNKYLNHYGPFFMIAAGPDEYRDRYYVQYQGKENGWFVSGEWLNRMMDEYDFMKILGLESLGIGLKDIIDNFFVEE